MSIVKPVFRYDLNHDVDAVQAMASHLVPFVYENEMFGYTPDDLPKLTIGGLLMRLHRLAPLSNLLSDEQRERLAMAQQHVDSVKQEWLVAYTNKTNEELIMCINEWNQFLNECRQNEDECREWYPLMAEKRVMVQVLANESRKLNALIPETENQMKGIDSPLQGYFKPGNFIWDQRLQQIYPQDQYGFLYMTI